MLSMVGGIVTLMVISWGVTLLNFRPYTLVRMNDMTGKEAVEVWGHGFLLLVLFFAVYSAMFLVAFFSLAWIPADWGGTNDVGEWESSRHAISVVLATYAGVLLFRGIGKGAEAQVAALRFRTENLLNEQMDKAVTIQHLQQIKEQYASAAEVLYGYLASKGAQPDGINAVRNPDLSAVTLADVDIAMPRELREKLDRLRMNPSLLYWELMEAGVRVSDRIERFRIIRAELKHELSVE